MRNNFQVPSTCEGICYDIVKLFEYFLFLMVATVMGALLCDEINKDEMGGACDTYRKDEKCTQNFGRPRHRWGIILQWILGK